MNIINGLIISFLAGASTIIGALVIFLPIKKQNINKIITFGLAFSLTMMIGISLFDLLPSSLPIIKQSYGFYGIILIVFLFIISFITIKVITYFLNAYENNLYKLGILSMITLMMHNLPEGITTFLSSSVDINLGIRLSIAISMHNIPEGIAIALPIYYSTKSKKKAILLAAFSGLAEPLGALLAWIFLSPYITSELIAIILIIVCGLMITLAIEKMLPESVKYHENKFLSLGIIVGLLITIVTMLFH